jgi:hypothetical protein
MNDPVVNVDAEANVLAALLQDGKQLTQVLDLIGPDDFYQPRAALLLETMMRLAARDEPVEPRRITDELARNNELTKFSADGWLPNLATRDHVFAMQAPYYAGMVLRASRSRQLQALATGIDQRVIQSDADPDQVLDFVDDHSRRMRDQLTAIDGPLPTLMQLASRDNTMKWVVPGLIAQHDRVILVGHEGFGKSLMVTQVAVAAAAGLHPFTLAPIPQTRVLVVDCENDPDTVTERADLLLSLSLTDGNDPSGHLFYVERPGGLELSKGSDAAWLSRLVARTRPQMLVIGPLYRLTESDLAKDEASRGVIAALDRVRLRADCALLMEAHVGNESHDGNRPYRPYGASIWRRWAGVGMSMKPASGVLAKDHVYRLADYRGKRSKREWPEYVAWGKTGSWPWRGMSFREVEEFKLLATVT